MTAFAWLKAMQTAITLTSFVVVLTCGHALIFRWRDRYTAGGYLMTSGVFMLMLGLMLLQGWQASAYWFAGVDQPITPPTWLRLISSVLFLTGGAIFVALTQQAVQGIKATFALWCSLVAMIIIMIAFAG